MPRQAQGSSQDGTGRHQLKLEAEAGGLVGRRSATSLNDGATRDQTAMQIERQSGGEGELCGWCLGISAYRFTVGWGIKLIGLQEIRAFNCCLAGRTESYLFIKHEKNTIDKQASRWS
jgi:hypothetical protein